MPQPITKDDFSEWTLSWLDYGTSHSDPDYQNFAHDVLKVAEDIDPSAFPQKLHKMVLDFYLYNLTEGCDLPSPFTNFVKYGLAELVDWEGIAQILYDDVHKNVEASTKKTARLPERIDEATDTDGAHGFIAETDDVPPFNAAYIKNWMESEVESLHNDVYFEGGGEPRYETLAMKAAFDVDKGHLWLDDPNHPIFDIAVEVLDSFVEKELDPNKYDYSELFRDDTKFRASKTRNRKETKMTRRKKADYSWVTQEMFDAKLAELLSSDPSVWSITGLYDVVADELHDEAIAVGGDFNEALDYLVSGLSGHQLLAIPGVYEVVSEELNNDVLSELEEERVDDYGNDDDDEYWDEDEPSSVTDESIHRPRRPV